MELCTGIVYRWQKIQCQGFCFHIVVVGTFTINITLQIPFSILSHLRNISFIVFFLLYIINKLIDIYQDVMRIALLTLNLSNRQLFHLKMSKKKPF